MRIAVLGWGSLIREPRDLPIVGGWRHRGPRLPIELSRMSHTRGHLTFVIDPRHKRLLPTRYALLRLDRVADAVSALAAREGCPPRRIGYVTAKRGARHRSRTGQWRGVQKWLERYGLDAAVWTDLPPQPGRFTVDAAIRRWKRWPQLVRAAAREYVNMAPAEIDTELRRRLAREHLI